MQKQTKKNLVQKAKRASRDERFLKPFLAISILGITLCAFFELISTEISLIVILPLALAGIAHPTSRGAPSYSELIDLIETEEEEVDPIVDVLSRKA